MKKIYIILTILAISCTPVRKSYYANDPENSPDYKLIKEKKEKYINKNAVKSESTNIVEYPPKSETFTDTQKIVNNESYLDENNVYDVSKYENVNANFKVKENDVSEKNINETFNFANTSADKSSDVVGSYQDALAIFDTGNYALSAEKFRALSETLKEKDTLISEINFYLAESYIANNEFSKAMDILKKLESENNQNIELNQKVLVRLGQIYCILNMKNEANKYFKKLAKFYPNSVYLKLSNCN